jgi:hypothetical protein
MLMLIYVNPIIIYKLGVSIICSILFFLNLHLHLLNCLCRLLMLVQCFAFVNSIFVDLNISFNIGSNILLSNNTFNPCRLLVVHMYPM